jgi:hypothetical protein
VVHESQLNTSVVAGRVVIHPLADIGKEQRMKNLQLSCMNSVSTEPELVKERLRLDVLN